MAITLPETFKIVDATAGPVTTNGGVTGDYVSLKNAVNAWLILQFTQAVAHQTVIQPKYATLVDGTGVTNITHTARFWYDSTTASADALTKGTAATSMTLANTIAKHMYVVELNPADWGAAGYDVAGFTISDSSQATNFVSGVYIIEERYAQGTPPSAIID